MGGSLVADEDVKKPSNTHPRMLIGLHYFFTSLID